ncbi:MAG: hypothetical protein CMH38_12405 [Microbacterium sp.]|uniref:hypothetical protein n=1 Tax=Microbacterium sp. TaxID=51671 RepID=UPI000C535F4B|nr:hypothetical protein [Microbacterium sp.]MAY50699.1 hypothetical protein [Microbacterium sp.]HBR89660.1 hypothetical protein [Microbacterium sp.]HBS75934.1 hypothetical protein [Microbacterium sp.]
MGFELAELLRELGLDVAVLREDVRDRLVHCIADVLDRVRRQRFSGDDGEDLSLDLFDAKPRQ